MSDYEKRYKVIEHFDGTLRISEAAGQRRKTTVRLIGGSGLEWKCATIISILLWDESPKTPEEARNQFIDNLEKQIKTYERNIQINRIIIGDAICMRLELAPNRRIK